MKKMPRSRRRMNSDEYAGFLKLLLKPNRPVDINSEDVGAYIRYLAEQAPITEDTRRRIGLTREYAA
jgi:hypothetical protein